MKPALHIPPGPQILRSYVQAMVGREWDLCEALKWQQEEADVKALPDVQRLLRRASEAAITRHEALVACARALDGTCGEMVKMGVAGSTVSIFGKPRPQVVSCMLQEDITALNLAATSYGMLYTAAVALDHEDLMELALDHLEALPEDLHDMVSMLPELVVEELRHEYELINLEAAEAARSAMERTWPGHELNPANPQRTSHISAVSLYA